MFFLLENESRARENWKRKATHKLYGKKGFDTTIISPFFAKKTQLVGGKTGGYHYQWYGRDFRDRFAR
jgi:hypothetical protein